MILRKIQRQSEFCEVFEDFATDFRFRLLIGEQPVFQMGTETCFHPEHRGLGRRTAMGADSFFPAFATKFANVANRFVASQRRLLAVSVSLDLRILSRRNHWSDLAFRQLAVNLPFVIRTVAVKPAAPVRSLIQQHRYFRRVVRQVVRDDFLCVGIDRQMQLPPRAMLRPTVFLDFPLAFAPNTFKPVLSTTMSILPFLFVRRIEMPSFAARLQSEV